MITAWRIIKAKHQDSAFNGDGARLYGGRWNTKGVPMVYVAESLALASLEIIIHLPADELLKKFVRIPVKFSPKLVSEVDMVSLPAGWVSDPAPAFTKLVGNRWIKNQESVVLKVPSAIIPEEFNYLINPLHPDYKKLSIGSPVAYFFDHRLKK
ncbi:MAG: RES domain-containing protein [Deltaproteobacteria bacterium]|nr:RES domain-containing protein [Deltaproteobacteria bacterium]